MVKPEIVEKALKAIKRAADYEYFFDQLSSPSWIEPLWEAGLFKSPFEPIKEDDYIRFPHWPESRYLARMAPLAPEIVKKVCLKIPDTENIRIHEDLVDAALKMPANLSAAFVPKAKVWIETSYPSLLSEKLGELVSHLAKGGIVTGAFDLAQALLVILPDPRANEKEGEDERYPISLRPQARFDSWHYEQILKKNIPDLIVTSGVKSFELLCNQLDSAISLSHHRRDDEGIADYSYISRPDIDSQQHHDLQNILITAVRSAAIQITRSDTAQLPNLVSKLEQDYRWHIFKRIALNLLHTFPGVVPVLVSDRLLNADLLDADWCQNEYRQLLKNRFSQLSPQEQTRWLSLIEQGPPTKPWRGKETISPQELEQEAIRWKRDCLAPIADQLPKEWREKYPDWTGGLTVPEDFAPSRVISWMGPTSPKSRQDLKNMSIEDLLTFLRTWRPPEGHFASSPEGLGRELTMVVAEDAARFAEEAVQFQGLDPTYARSIIRGLEEACKNKKSFNWTPVLELCRWISTQLKEISNRPISGHDADPDWRWTRQAIARLLSAGFDQNAHEISFGLRQKVWLVLEPITHDPNPDLEYETTGTNMDAATMSINTVRGEAIHTVVRYALWIHRDLEKLTGGKEKLLRGFDEIPEVREVLEEHLDTSNDHSMAIRTIYGQWFPWLVLLDPRWATLNVPRIFPRDPSLRHLLDAAWETYLTFCKPYNNVFEILQEEYRLAIDRIGQPSKNRPIADPEERLAEHLAIQYLRGQIRLDDPDNLLSYFYQKTTDKLRAHIIEFIGRDLYHQKETFEPEILERSKILWVKRFNTFKTSALSSNKAEFIPFGWWFASGKFDDTWAMRQLIEVLEITGWAELDHLVIEHLASLAGNMPRQVLECLQMMIDGDKEGWHVIGWRTNVRAILSTIIQGSDLEAQQAAIDLVHRLGARRHLEFRDLLPRNR